MKKDIIVFDIDGTLSLVGDRKECLMHQPKNWDEFYSRCGEDRPNQSIIDLVFPLSLKYHIYLVTGRRESCRYDTINWLAEYDLINHVHELLMRPNGDFRHDTILKPELIKPFQNRIITIFEDRDSMVKKWREIGLSCCQVAEGNF